VFFAPQAGTMDDLYKKLPSQCKAGDVLVGTANFLKRNKDQVAFGTDEKADGYPICLVLPAKQQQGRAEETSDTASSAQQQQPKFASEQEEEQWIIPLLRARLQILESVSKDELFEREFSETEEAIKGLDTPTGRAELTLTAKLITLRRAVKKFRESLHSFESHPDTDVDLNGSLSRLVEAAEQIRSCVDIPSLEQKKLAGKISVVDGEIVEKDVKSDQDVKTRTDALCEALFAKAHALMDVDAVLSPSSSPSVELISLVDELARWVSEKTTSFQQLRLRFALRARRLASALSVVDKLLQEEESELQKLPSPETRKGLMDRKIDILEELGWNHLANAAKECAFVEAPLDYPLF